MRSRYTAYVRGDADYLLRTWLPRTRPASLDVDGVAWRGLTVAETRGGGEHDAHGTVTFTAVWEAPDGSLRTMTERSEFVHEGGHWLYVDGVTSL